MIDATINLPTIVTLTMIGVGAIIWLIRMEGRINAAEHSADTISKELGALEALVMLHKEQFHEYQLQAAKEFMTQAAFAEIKRELLSEIGRMEVRLEAQIDRLGSRAS